MTRESREDAIIRDLLDHIERTEGVNQRGLAKDLGIALGLANTYIKRCVKKGLIKVSEAPARRYRYYLTPMGFAEKTRLTAEFLTSSFQFFRRARNQYGALYEHCVAAGWSHLALAGISDLAEIASLYARDYPVSLQGVIEPERAGETYLRLPVVADATEFPRLDAVLITSLKAPQETFERITQMLPSERVLAPQMISIVSDRDWVQASAREVSKA